MEILKIFGDLLPYPLCERVDLYSYASKLITHADIAYAFLDGKIVGFLSLYANDEAKRQSFLPILVVLPSVQGHGLGKVLMSRALALARQRRMKVLKLEVNRQNFSAQKFYLSLGFKFDTMLGESWMMRYEINNSYLSELNETTQIDKDRILMSMFDGGIELFIKRDDLFPMSGGGTKARKMKYIIRDIVDMGHNVIVTNGGPQSNHARAAALVAARIGMKCHIVIVLEPGIRYPISGNILLMKLAGAIIEYCCKDQLSKRMDQAIEFYKKSGHNPAYVWGGGHCHAGTLAFIDAAVEAQIQCVEWVPDYIVLASGTGTTQAGLAIGYADLPTRIIGISVARESERGCKIISECIQNYYENIGSPSRAINVHFRDDWNCGGYEKTNTNLIKIVEQSAKDGLIVDPTYSGKALYGLAEMVKSGEIQKGSKVIFWHTGGLLNLMASQFANGSVSL